MDNGDGDEEMPGTSSSSSSSSSSRITRSGNNRWEMARYNPYTSRLRQFVRNKRVQPQVCPICNALVTRDIVFHVDLCLRTTEADDSESDENVRIPSYEELEWANDNTLNPNVSMLSETQANDTAYGLPEFSESNVAVPNADSDNIPPTQGATNTDAKQLRVLDDKNPEIIKALENKIRELEIRLHKNKNIYKCSICMGAFKTPVISTVCWHVHCEQCWLQALTIKTRCPLCNLITFPLQLRKIYL